MAKKRRVLEAEAGLKPRTASHGPILTLELSPMLILNSGRGLWTLVPTLWPTCPVTLVRPPQPLWARQALLSQTGVDSTTSPSRSRLWLIQPHNDLFPAQHDLTPSW